MFPVNLLLSLDFLFTGNESSINGPLPATEMRKRVRYRNRRHLKMEKKYK